MNGRRQTCRLVALLSALIFTCGTCRATIIFVTLTRQAIFIGADARTTLTNDAGKESYGTTCKIRGFGQVTVAVSGTLSDTSSNFDIWRFLDSIRKVSVADFAREIADRLPTLYGSIDQTRTLRGSRVTQGAIPGQVAVLGFQANAPTFFSVRFLEQNGTIKAVLRDEGVDLAKNKVLGALTVPFGEYWALPFPGPTDCDDDGLANAAEYIRCSITEYITADPKHVNGPIAIIKITPSGSEWIDRGACSDARP